MNRKAIRIMLLVLVLVLLAGTGIGLYLYFNTGTIIGKISFGTKYYQNDLLPSKYFPGAKDISADNYFLINSDQQTGEIYLNGYDVNPIPFIVTNYHESNQNTTIELEMVLIIDTIPTIQKFVATSTDTEIRIKHVMPHGAVVTQENPDPTLNNLEYESTLMAFKKEVN